MNAADITHALNSPINKGEMPPSEFLFEEIEEAETPLFSKKAHGEKGHVSQGDIASLLELFENAKTFGSLIQIPPKLAAKLPEIEKRLTDVLKHGDLTHASAHVIRRCFSRLGYWHGSTTPWLRIRRTWVEKYFTGKLKDFVAEHFKEAKGDLYACFIKRNRWFVKRTG